VKNLFSMLLSADGLRSCSALQESLPLFPREIVLLFKLHQIQQFEAHFTHQAARKQAYQGKQSQLPWATVVAQIQATA
jgi:hypothetical protein